MDKRTQKKKIIIEILLFLLKFNLILIPFYLVIYLDLDFYPAQRLFANLVGNFLELLGISVEVSGIFIYARDLAIDISRDCIGWKGAYSLTALVLASPGKFKKKIKNKRRKFNLGSRKYPL